MTAIRNLNPIRAGLLVVAMLGALAACSKGGGGAYELGPITRMNDVEGLAGTFSWPYYTAITARGGNVVAAWLNRSGQRDRDLVVRASADAGDTWSAEQLMNDGEYQRTVSVVPKLAPLPAGSLFCRGPRPGFRHVAAAAYSYTTVAWPLPACAVQAASAASVG